MRRRMNRFLSGLLVLSLGWGMVLEVQATTVEEAKQEAEELEEQKEQAEQKAEELENQKNQTEAEKNSLTTQLNTILGEMQETQEKMLKKEEEIEAKEEELTQAKIDENDQYESMKKRIKFMYENGDMHFLELLVNSENISEFLNKAEYVSEISEYDRNMLTEFQEVVKQVEEQEAELQAEYEELSGLQVQLGEQQAEVQALLDATNTKLADLETQIGDNAAKLQELIAEAEAAAERQRQAELAAQAAVSAASQGGSSAYVDAGPSVISGNGIFTHPCPSGYITSQFGEYRSPSDPSHKGTDFGTGGQAVPTYAAADGTVVIAGWSNSAGNWVVINHGNGLVTKYMHHSALCVSAGQRVTKGQQIGLTGNTGYSSGVHLHFQVELNGVAVDPMNYL